MATLTTFDGANSKSINLSSTLNLGEWLQWIDANGDEDELITAAAWYYACVMKLAGTTTAIPRQFVTLAGDEVDEADMPIGYRWAGGSCKLGAFMSMSSISLTRHAAAYWGKVMAGSNVARLRWLDATTITPYYNNVGLDYFERTVSGKPMRYYYDDDTGRTDEIGWVWQLGTAEAAPGVAPETVANRPARILSNIDRYAESFFSRGAISQHWITADHNPPQAEKDSIQARLRRVFFGGVNTAHDVEIFNAGMKVEKIGSDPGELAMGEIDTANQVDVAAVLQTPLLIVNPNDTANRAVMDRIWSTWISYTVVPHAQMIVDGLNLHIFEPEGYRIELKPDTMTELQEEERQKAQAVALYVGNGFNPEWVVGALGIEGPEDVPMMADTPPVMPPIVPQGEEDDASREDRLEEEGMDESRRSLEYGKLRRFIAAGKHKTRPFHSDILTVEEIAEEVGAAQDAPFRATQTATKQGPLQVGDSTLDPELRRYYRELDELAERARSGNISRDDFKRRMKELAIAAIMLAFALGGGDETIPGAAEALAEQERISNEAVDNLADEIYGGGFGEDEELGRTDDDGREKLLNRLALWTATAAGVYALGQVHQPPEVVDGVEVEPTFEWVLGATSVHCTDCLRLNGQVHTASEWRAAGIAPQSPDLECGGWNCDCRLDATDAPSIGMAF